LREQWRTYHNGMQRRIGGVIFLVVLFGNLLLDGFEEVEGPIRPRHSPVRASLKLQKLMWPRGPRYD